MGFRRESAPLYAHWAGHWATAHCPLPTAHCPLPGVRCVCAFSAWRRVGVSNTALGIQLDSHSYAKASTSHP